MLRACVCASLIIIEDEKRDVRGTSLSLPPQTLSSPPLRPSLSLFGDAAAAAKGNFFSLSLSPSSVPISPITTTTTSTVFFPDTIFQRIQIVRGRAEQGRAGGLLPPFPCAVLQVGVLLQERRIGLIGIDDGNGSIIGSVGP